MGSRDASFFTRFFLAGRATALTIAFLVVGVPGADAQGTVRERLQALEERADELEKAQLPVGTVIAYAGPAGPGPGWLECDGTELPSSAHPNLARALSVGTPGSTFELPDYRGRFLKGYKNKPLGPGDKAPPAAVGTNQGAAHHKHKVGGVRSASRYGGELWFYDSKGNEKVYMARDQVPKDKQIDSGEDHRDDFKSFLRNGIFVTDGGSNLPPSTVARFFIWAGTD